jgi:putative ABC transport system permease protein
MESLWQDLRFAWRMLVKRPGFTLIAVLTLALGIGINTSIFSVINSVLLKPLPYRDPEKLVTLRSNESTPDLADIANWSQSYVSVGGIVTVPLDFTGGSEPAQWRTGLVTGGYFETLGVKPLLGRGIDYNDDKEGNPFVLTLSHEVWQSRFGGDAQIVGRTIPLSGNTYTVIGVMPPSFKSPRETVEAWAPLHVVNPLAAKYRGVHFLRSYLRLKDTVTIAQAQSELQGIDKRLAAAHPEENKNRRGILIPLHDRVVGQSRNALWLLFGAVSLVLLIACVNFANLLLARAAEREREFVIRAALGAGRGRLIRQLLTESILIAVAGGALSIMFAMWGIDLLAALKPEDLPRLDEIAIDRRVLLFTLGVSVAVGLIFGLMPAWNSSRHQVGEALKEGGRAATAGSAKQRLRKTLVVLETAFAVILLIGAGLLIRSFSQLHSVNTGFNSENMLTMRIDLPEARYKEISKQANYRRAVLSEVNSLPGVEAVMVSELPLSGDSLNHDFTVEGRPPVAPGDEPSVETRSVEGDYFRVMQIPLLAGRALTEQDNENSQLVGVVNEALVRQYFPNENPIGARVRWARDEQVNWITIVGVVGDVKHFGLNDSEEPALYTPYAQSGREWKRWMNLAVRSSQEPTALAAAVKSRLWKIDSQIPATRIRSMADVISVSVATERFNMLLLGVFAALALALAAIGIYGVVAYSVTQRTHELGIRVALGAQSKDVLSLVIGQGIKLVVIGLGIGLIAAFGLTRLMRTLLFNISPGDPLTFALVAAALMSVALLACYLPALRATRVDPMIALRSE